MRYRMGTNSRVYSFNLKTICYNVLCKNDLDNLHANPGNEHQWNQWENRLSKKY